MNVKFFSDYDSSQRLLQRFNATYTINDMLLKFTIDEDYEFAVVFNSTNEIINNNAKVITIIQEPSWNHRHFTYDCLTHSDYLIVHDQELFERTYGLDLGCKIIESPTYLFYHDDVDKTFYHYTRSTEKIRRLSIIISDLNRPQGIYNKRIGLLNKILESDLDIDIYGRGLNIEDRRFKGCLEYKFLGLLPYDYSIAIENSVEKNYITEKFVDCVLCETIPIYHGAPNIAEVYDQRFFKTINLDSFSIVEDIKNIISEPAVRSTVNKEIYFTRFNLYNKLKEIIFG